MKASPISAATVALYRRYDGDADGLSRSADRGVDIYDDWRAIDELRQRAFIVATGRGSEPFCQRFQSDLAAYMPDERARREFDELVQADLKAASARA